MDITNYATSSKTNQFATGATCRSVAVNEAGTHLFAGTEGKLEIIQISNL